MNKRSQSGPGPINLVTIDLAKAKSEALVNILIVYLNNK